MPRTVSSAARLTVGEGRGLDRGARAVLEAHWRRTATGGFTVPHASTYPWQWLWDSCFHAVVWAHLGDERAVLELRSVFDAQDPSGFVPHVNYRGDRRYDEFWGRAGTSCITQPPVYGLAASVLAGAGIEPGAEVLEKATRAHRHLLRDRPRHRSGLVALLHPWESGADDSPRWNDWCGDRWSADRWYDVKGALVTSIERDGRGAGRSNPEFDVAAASFNALLAHDVRRLAGMTGDDRLDAEASGLAELVASRWEEDLRTWTDAGRASGRVRTLDALLGALVDDDHAAVALRDAVDVRAYGGATGPAGVHRDEADFEPGTYWRGAAWPQLTYLLWVAATRRGEGHIASSLATALAEGATRSGFAEYWHPDRGEPGGAVPQSWAALAAVVAPRAIRGETRRDGPD